MPAPLSDKQRAAILADIQAGEKSRGQIARDHKVSTTSVSKIAADAGISAPFSREQTKKATAALAADNKALRAQLATGSLEGAKEALAEIRNAITGASLRDLAVTYGVLIDKHLAMEKHDTSSESHAAVDAWLLEMTGL